MLHSSLSSSELDGHAFYPRPHNSGPDTILDCSFPDHDKAKPCTKTVSHALSVKG